MSETVAQEVLSDNEQSSFGLQDCNLSEITKVRKQRDHPYTKHLNRIKSKICYYKKGEPSPETNSYIDALEYERFVLKLNPHDMQVIEKFCHFNKLPHDINAIRNLFVSKIK